MNLIHLYAFCAYQNRGNTAPKLTQLFLFFISVHFTNTAFSFLGSKGGLRGRGTIEHPFFLGQAIIYFVSGRLTTHIFLCSKEVWLKQFLVLSPNMASQSCQCPCLLIKPTPFPCTLMESCQTPGLVEWNAVLRGTWTLCK